MVCMMTKVGLALIISISLFTFLSCSPSSFQETQDQVILISSLKNPWGMAFIDHNKTEMLITQKSGELMLFNTGSHHLVEIKGVPEVSNIGQGGLLDVDYDDGFVYLTYSAEDQQGLGYATHVARARLNKDLYLLEDLEVLRVIEPFIGGGAHFGSRVLVVEDYIFVTTGDRGSKDFSGDHPSQDTSNELGSVLRLYKDGSVPQDNPFVGIEGFVDSIYTYGHRNVQGIVYYDGSVYISEHGEQDGDMIHRLVGGKNYGWPIVHYGCTYILGQPIGGFAHQRDDIQDPIHYWECGSGGFPPSGMDVFEHRLYVGTLGGSHLGEFEWSGEGLVQTRRFVEGERVRDVKSFQEGLYVITDSGKLIKIIV